MVKRASAPGKTTENVAKCRCNLGEEQLDKREIQEKIDSFQPGVDREAAGGWVHARDVLHVVDVLLCQLGLAVPGVAMMELVEMMMMMMIVMSMLTNAHSPCAGG